jgi:hypothetical protein
MCSVAVIKVPQKILTISVLLLKFFTALVGLILREFSGRWYRDLTSV